MALERVPADIRKDGGIARMSDPKVLSCGLFFKAGDILLPSISHKFQKMQH